MPDSFISDLRRNFGSSDNNWERRKNKLKKSTFTSLYGFYLFYDITQEYIGIGSKFLIHTEMSEQIKY